MKSFYPKGNWVKWKSRIEESVESLIKWAFEKTVNKSWQNRCAVGSKAWNPLYEEIKDTYETYVIGDAKEVAQALEAVRGAYELGYRL